MPSRQWWLNLATYKHYVYAFPQNACGGLGAGTIGGNPSEAWINGSLDLKVLSHEMGHNFGLYHSHALDCGTAVLGTNCRCSSMVTGWIPWETPRRAISMRSRGSGWDGWTMGSRPPSPPSRRMAVNLDTQWHGFLALDVILVQTETER